VSEALAAIVDVTVYELELTTDIILYSLLRTAAVILPPKLTAPENVTKSFSLAP
jgi:hypothetical protein